MSHRPQPQPRAHFRHFLPITTRRGDNDACGHVSNVVCHGGCDTAVNASLVQHGALDIQRSPSIGLVVETRCSHVAPLAFPQPVEAGLRVQHLGRSSVRYGIGIFAAGAPLSVACGHFVHVDVDHESRQPVPVPATVADAVRSLLDPDPAHANRP